VVVLFALSPTTADGPGGGGPIIYTGAPSPLAIAKGKLILLFHPLLDGSGIIGAAILVMGMGLILLLMLRFSRPRISRTTRFLILGLALLVVITPNGIGAGYGLDYRLVAPMLCVTVCGTTLTWASRNAHRAIFAILLVVSASRSTSFIVDFWRGSATFRAFDASVSQIPRDSVLLTGIGSPREETSWETFWRPPSEYLATDATAARVFVPNVFAIASQHPLVVNSRFDGWSTFMQFGTPADAIQSYNRLAAICADWTGLRHTGRVLVLVVYLSNSSTLLIPRSAVMQSGPGFELIDGCRLASSPGG
jgi:hypothetical protein